MYGWIYENYLGQNFLTWLTAIVCSQAAIVLASRRVRADGQLPADTKPGPKDLDPRV